jgi:hypothetical protein
MKAWIKFAETLELTRELEDMYFKIREIFQREGWTETDRTIRDYGFDVDGQEVSHYIIKKLSHIDDITPLREPDANY